MSDRDESSLAAATAPAAARCCPYLLRIVAGTANVLNKPVDQRRSHQCLSSMVEWLFSECASVDAQFRRQCMHLFTALCPLLPDSSGPADWICSYIRNHSLSSLLMVFEGAIVSPPALPGQWNHQVRFILDASVWLKQLTTCIDAYAWCLHSGYITVADMLGLSMTNRTSSSKKKRSRKGASEDCSTSDIENQVSASRVLDWLRFFLSTMLPLMVMESGWEDKRCADGGDPGVIVSSSSLSIKEAFAVLSPSESQKFAQIKSLLFRRACSFFTFC